jgi:cyanophycinase
VREGSESERPVLGLMGSGEFLPWAEEVDRWLVEHARTRSRRVVVLPTASAPEGDDVFDRWASMGIEHYTRMGLEPEVLPLKTREDAMREDLAEQLVGAGLIFFSGGNPRYLAETLRDTATWRAILEAIAAGTAFGGCSAGVAFLGERAPDSTRVEMTPDVYGPGLAYFPGVEFAPHWDALDVYMPGLQAFVRENLAPGSMYVLLDEDTAMVGDGEAWTVMGRGKIRVGRIDTEHVFEDGESFTFTEVGAGE